MQFRPCIDIHNGAVKQIVGSSLKDEGDAAKENFVAEQDASFYAEFYKKRGISGGHVILLNHAGSEYYEATRSQALAALAAYPGGLQAGGGITPENGADYLQAGASHVIVSSYIFSGDRLQLDRLKALKQAVGKEHLTLDVSCRRYEDGYFVSTDRWQHKTDFKVNEENLDLLSGYCDEFLIHAVDVEGRGEGIEKELAALLGSWLKTHRDFYEKVTYAGGVKNLTDLKLLDQAAGGGLNVTVGSALDLFGGSLSFDEVTKYCIHTQKNR